jgi:hypothetical protein
MLRLAVRMTNVLTEKLGCGGEPLPEPAAGAVPDTGTYVPRAEVKGTACDALATTRVPAQGRDGTVRIAVADGGVVGRCTLRAAGEAEADPGPAARRAHQPAWGLGTNVRELGSGPDSLPMGGGVWKPAPTEHRAWAVARCDGENTGSAAHWSREGPGQARELHGIAAAGESVRGWRRGAVSW